ncbi:uncharacterized protein LOC131242430 isoform X2 [Magnolia sinica]|uniref:uncharacterized protein LOC131242430 isoform X2 n=1 Tax=Magnolia sinica TaxID=86752 RepID=UPI00265B6CD2|nr:uncharacterized protein LOC131242430 isoform X2 [Magnolia sinica]
MERHPACIEFLGTAKHALIYITHDHMHIKGSRHMAAESRLKERELWKQEEIKKRIALSGDSAGATSSSPSNKQFQLSSKPLIERTRKAAFEALHNQMPEPNAANGCHDVKFRGNASYFDLNCQSASERGMEPSPSVTPGPCHLDERSSKCEKRADGEMLVEQQARQERELKFTSAGWKRNCHGRWFRDENVEFDSDEEDPNISLT